MATAIPTNTVKEDGGTFIPASQRPDGTWRKPRRVKDGYVPQEEVPLYESKGKQWAKGKPGHVVGMNPAASRQPNHLNSTYNAPAAPRSTIPGLNIAPTEQASKSKKKKKKKTGDSAAVAEVTEALAGTQLNWPGGKEASAPAATDPAKRLKNLKKRLREVEALEQKITSGELKNPDKDQLEKVKRKDDLHEQIAELEDELAGK